MCICVRMLRLRAFFTYLLLGLDGALEESLDRGLEVLDLLALEAVELGAEQAPHVVEEEAGLVDLALGVGDLGADLVEAVLLGAALAEELVLGGAALLELRLRRVPRVERLLPLRERLLHAADQPHVLVDRDPERQHVLLRLPVVHVPDRQL